MRSWNLSLSKNASIIFLLFLLSSCSNFDSQETLKQNEIISLVEKVCDGNSKLSWQQRANVATQAAYFDSRWKKLSKYANYAASQERIDDTMNKDYKISEYGNQIVDFYYQRELAYSEFVATCSVIEKIKPKD